jgi:hypothetical protein
VGLLRVLDILQAPLLIYNCLICFILLVLSSLPHLQVDTTLQNMDQWFYHPVVGLRELPELQKVYHGSVGRNGNTHCFCVFILSYLSSDKFLN